MHIKRRSVVVILGSFLVFTANGCGIRSNLDEGDSVEEEITVASAMDSGTKSTEDEDDKSFCGDGRLDLQRGEQCDGLNLGYASCESLGQGTGNLRCSPACYFDVTGCYTPPPTNVTPGPGQTTPIGGSGGTGYGSDPFADIADIISGLMDQNRDTDSSTNTDDDSSTDPRQRFGGQNTGN